MSWKFIKYSLLGGYFLWFCVVALAVLASSKSGIYSLGAKGTPYYQIVEMWESGRANELTESQLVELENFIRPIRNARRIGILAYVVLPLILVVPGCLIINRKIRRAAQ